MLQCLYQQGDIPFDCKTCAHTCPQLGTSLTEACRRSGQRWMPKKDASCTNAAHSPTKHHNILCHGLLKSRHHRQLNGGLFGRSLRYTAPHHPSVGRLGYQQTIRVFVHDRYFGLICRSYHNHCEQSSLHCTHTDSLPIRRSGAVPMSHHASRKATNIS